ncbi:tyrosine-type recombinase/integrase [Dysosmobacter sp.]|uniref:tyrosine-type recombinase/integrase n=1 Tax=Dysosmobacter sp. TaxID=2591382 RepID=UPI003A8E2041
MAEKRKDKKGRILKDGESYRSDGRYMYRYMDIRGNRKCIYAQTLSELREKEQLIQRDLQDGIDYAAGSITVLALVERYIPQRQGVRYNTKVGYNFVLNLLKKEDFAYRQIKDIKPSDAKQWFIKLHDDGYKYSSITTVRGVLRPAFEMAVEDDIVRRNPFSFRVVDVVPNDSVTRKALSQEEKEKYLAYVLGDKCRRRYYDEIIILLGTGLRISELYGLTKSDIDFKERRIRVERQLTRTRNCEYYIEKPKTDSGERYVPMDGAVYQAFQNVIQNRKTPKVEMLINGHSGFLFLDKDGKPKVAGHLEHAMKRIIDNYNKSHDDKLPSITPHVLRHTFCTEMANAGMEIKNLQYLMGHADAYTTLNTYTHSSYVAAEKAHAKIAANR